MDTLYLVDGSNYLFRAFHALPNLTNAAGMPTGAIYGVVNMLKRLQTEYQPEYAAVVFDAKGGSFRNDLYPEYKANRSEMPEDLVPQIAKLHPLIEALGFTLLCESGVEADDVIGTLASQADAAGMQVRIFTGDKDMAQLVNDRVWMVDTMKEVNLDPQGVFAKFGVKPTQIIDYLTLMGDKVDNIPGVPKVGPKTAAKWLGQYDNLDALLNHADEIKGKVGENLREALPQLPLSRELVTIRCDVDLPYLPEQLSLAAADTERLVDFYADLGFKTWLAEMLEQSGETEAGTHVESVYHTILSLEDWALWRERLETANTFAFDTETDSLDALNARIVGVSFALDCGEAAYLPLRHSYIGVPIQLDMTQILAELKPILENPKIAKLGQNLKYDAHVLLNHGIELRGIAEDTLLASYVLDSNGRHDLDTLALKYLSRRLISYEDVAGKGKQQIPFAQVALEQAVPYAAEDAEVCVCLNQSLQQQLEKTPHLQRVYRELEMPLLPVILKMERRGVLVDVEKLQQQSTELGDQIQQLEQQAYEVAGEKFNLGSPKQLQAILFEKLELPVLKKTPKGQPSTAESVLQNLADEYELPRIIMQHRSLSKLKSTYTDSLPLQVNQKTGRIHSNYHQAVTATGRLSSSDPNLQNIPIRSAEGRKIRQAFIAPEGYVLLAADYSQVELRIMAQLSGDAGLLGAFERGEDVHSTTAAEIFDVALSEVTREQRRSAKAINFGLIYGMSAFGLAKQLKIERKLAQDYIDRYFARYPAVKDYMESIKTLAAEQGFVETAFGRRLYLNDINASNHQRRQYAERTAINAPMQGTAADLIKRAMIAIDTRLQTLDLDLHLIMQVHDELVFEVKQAELEAATTLIQTLMSDAGAGILDKVELTTEVGSGQHWDAAH